MKFDYLKFKGILFDKDGTLIDQSSYLYKAIFDACRYLCLRLDKNQTVFKQLLQQAGIKSDSKQLIDINKVIHLGFTNICEKWFDTLQISRSQHQEIKSEITKIFAKNHLVSNITNLNKFFSLFMQQDIKIGIATMDTSINTKEFIKDNNIQDQICFVACVDSGYGIKPDAGMVLAFCKKYKFSPKSVIVVGDSYNDMLMAKSAGSGLKIGIDRLVNFNDNLRIKSSELHPIADTILSSITQIPNIINMPKN